MSDESDRPESPAAPVPPSLALDDSRVTVTYANLCRVTALPEELLIDLGINTQLRPVPEQPVVLTQRVVLSFYTAKRLMQALATAVTRHEQAFGTLETNVQKRAK